MKLVGALACSLMISPGSLLAQGESEIYGDIKECSVSLKPTSTLVTSLDISDQGAKIIYDSRATILEKLFSKRVLYGTELSLVDENLDGDVEYVIDEVTFDGTTTRRVYSDTNVDGKFDKLETTIFKSPSERPFFSSGIDIQSTNTFTDTDGDGIIDRGTGDGNIGARFDSMGLDFKKIQMDYSEILRMYVFELISNC